MLIAFSSLAYSERFSRLNIDSFCTIDAINLSGYSNLDNYFSKKLAHSVAKEKAFYRKKQLLSEDNQTQEENKEERIDDNGIEDDTPFSEVLCKKPDFVCKKISTGQTWKSLFPNSETRDIVQRLNRMNIRLKHGMTIAIPNNLERLTIFDIAPFPRYVESEGEKIIYIDKTQLAWGAYNAEGELVWWGPISSGKKSCPNVLGGCTTPEGIFRIIRKNDASCISTSFPRRSNGIHGGAEMPFCMHFFKGYALHGSRELPGYPASHGCVRLFLKDAEWLNEVFIDIPGGGMPGTQVIISKS